MWRLFARFIANRPALVDWLICRALRTPYTHIYGRQNKDDLYMSRWWLFNPYPASGVRENWRQRWLPSVRIHHILRADDDQHLHDHPWDARTIILRGWYVEQRLMEHNPGLRAFTPRHAGDTARLNFGEYHRITELSPGGVYTLFITYRYRGTWGFLVDGQKVPWRVYLGIPE